MTCILTNINSKLIFLIINTINSFHLYIPHITVHYNYKILQENLLSMWIGYIHICTKQSFTVHANILNSNKYFSTLWTWKCDGSCWQSMVRKSTTLTLTAKRLHQKSRQSVQWMADVWMYIYLNRSIFLSNNIQKDDFSGKKVLFWELIKWDRDASRALLDRKQMMNPRIDLIS